MFGILSRWVRRAVFAMALPACWSCGAAEAVPALPCVDELLIPKYPPLARQARRSGEVRVMLELDDEARVRNASLSDAGPSLFAEEVKQTLSTVKFLPACAGKSVELVFRFEIDSDAPPRESDKGTVTIKFPGTIKIRAAAVPLNIATVSGSR